jgi:hypothetical protein
MRDLQLRLVHLRRDNVSGVVIFRSPPDFTDEVADKLVWLLVVLSSLELSLIDKHDLFSLREIQSIICGWSATYQHHCRDDGQVSGSRVTARNHLAQPMPESED